MIQTIFGGGTAAALATYAFAMPGAEPAMPVLVTEAAHHLHCMMHSALIAAAIGWLLSRRPEWCEASYRFFHQLAFELSSWLDSFDFMKQAKMFFQIVVT